MATKTIGRGKSKGMAQGRNAVAKAKANGARVAEMNAAAAGGCQHKGEWTSSKGIQPGDWVADAIKGRPANGPAEYRQVADATMANGMRRLEFTDGTARSMGAATKVFLAPGQLVHDGTEAGADEQALPSGPDRVAAAKAEHKALQAWIKAGENPPRPATPNLDALNAEHAPASAAARTASTTANPKATTRPEVPADHPFMRYVDADQVGKPVDPELGLVHTTDGHGLVRVHKATCKGKADLPVLAEWPTQLYAAVCCKPRTPGATARTKYVPPSKRTA